MAVFFNKKIVPIILSVKIILLELFSMETDVKRYVNLIIFHPKYDKFSELHLAC